MAKFTVVTACRNAARYIDETVESVLQQSEFRSGRSELEYLVFDGASTDGTVERLRPYESRGVEVVSEPDGGLYAALAKGLQQASGDYVAYLNAGDFYHPAGLSIAVDCFELPGVDWLTGYTVTYNERSQVTGATLPFRYNRKLIQCGAYGTLLPFVQQESTAWRRSLHASVDFARFAALRYAGDAYLWRSFSHAAELHIVRGQIGGFRVHTGQISGDHVAYEEELRSFSRPMGLGERLQCVWERALRVAPERIAAAVAARPDHLVFDHSAQAWRRAAHLNP
jgi:glycosyltransferase involved in cell wall biosynthesis